MAVTRGDLILTTDLPTFTTIVNDATIWNRNSCPSNYTNRSHNGSHNTHNAGVRSHNGAQWSHNAGVQSHNGAQLSHNAGVKSHLGAQWTWEAAQWSWNAGVYNTQWSTEKRYNGTYNEYGHR